MNDRGRKTGWLALLALVAIGGVLSAQSLEEIEQQFIQVAEKVRPSVVAISGKMILVLGEGEAGEVEELSYHTYSSGVVVSAEGHIITAGDAIRGSEELTVTFFDGTECDAEVVGLDEPTNLAVIQAKQGPLAPVTFAEPETVRAGSWVLAVGNPFGLSQSVSWGIVSGTGRILPAPGRSFTDMLQTTAPVNPGDAGGLVANLRGELVGITSSVYQRTPRLGDFENLLQELAGGDLGELIRDWEQLMERSREAGWSTERIWQEYWKMIMKRLLRQLGSSDDQQRADFARRAMPGQLLGAEGINFAQSVETVRFVTENLIQHGTVKRGWIGVEVKELRWEQRQAAGLEPGIGVAVISIPAGSPAGAAGVQPGDLLLEFDGSPITGLHGLQRLLRRRAPGTPVNLAVRRGSENLDFSVVLGLRE